MKPKFKLTEFNLRQRQLTSNLSFGKTYAIQEGELAASASMCLKACLNLNQKIRALYLDIIEAWSLPGMEVLENDIIVAAGFNYKDYLDWQNETLRLSKLKGYETKLTPFQPFMDTCLRHINDQDINHWYSLVSDLIRLGFNKQTDIDEIRPKVVIENAPLLVLAISYSSCAEYLGVNPGEVDRERLGVVHGLMNTATKDLTRYRERKVKTQVIKAFKSHGFTLIKEPTLYQYAEAWYKSRIDPGNIEKYIDELHKIKRINVERSRIENDIALCDMAIPGHRRKR